METSEGSNLSPGPMIPSDVPLDTFVEVATASDAPRLSILVPLYEQAAFVRQALESVLAQRGVVAEILISDDASTDASFATACEVLREHLARGTAHRILLRRGSRRLWRDHLALLVDTAGCDIVMQAHGDDISHPDRAAMICFVMASAPEIAMVASEAQTIDAHGRALDPALPIDPQRIAIEHMTLPAIIEGHPCLIGFSQAWRRSAMRPFARLETAYTPVAHDRTLALRAALVGEVRLIRAQLVQRRDHPMSGTQLSIFEPDTDGRFGCALIRLSSLRAMHRDATAAHALGLIDSATHDRILEQIGGLRRSASEAMLDAYHQLCLAGRVPVWLHEQNIIRRPAGPA